MPLDEVIGQQPQTPLTLTIGWGGAGQGDQMPSDPQERYGDTKENAGDPCA